MSQKSGHRSGMNGLLVTSVMLMAATRAPADEPPAKTEEASHAAPVKNIYDRTADGKQQIADSLVAAKRDNRRVLLQFGANWCIWCQRLHALCESDKAIAKELQFEYEVVLIDVDKLDDDKRHNADVNEKYGNPIQHGLPVLVVLDAEGKPLTTQETGSLEKGPGHDPAKVLAFLEKWQTKPIAAEEALSTALARAKSEKKNVLMHFSAPWCVWCKRLEAFMSKEEIAPIFDKAYVPLTIDIERMTGGKEMDAKYRGNPKSKGIPFIVMLDANGKKLADGNTEKGNIGYPASPEEVAHFMKIMKQTAPSLSEKELSTIESALKVKPK